MKLLLAAGLLVTAFVPVQASASSPFDGTWKINVSSASMPKKPDIFVLKDGMYTCQTCAPGYTVKADGTDQAVSGQPYYDTVAIKVVDDHTIRETDKKAGKTVTTSTVSVSKDGKTATFEFSDSSNSSGAPVTGKGESRLVAAGPAGSHAVSGSWITTGLTSFSDNGLTVTYKTDGDMLTMSSPTGQSYTAKMDGTDAPYKGDPGITTVSVKKVGPATLLESDKRGDKIVGTLRTTVDGAGDAATVMYHDGLRNRSTNWTQKKI
ncbi:MAG TPA: hypothetical protein VHU23_18630 [Rhizomicrobium sp.]|jgi:hypothetical protein|nr:hypothetical protein [Rhizomicrobium sp.]